jgi:LPS-assembly lipoprotein
MNTSRRRFGLWLGAGPVLAGLSACGFQLRSAGDYPFKTLFANFSTTSPLGVELRRNLLGTGRITLLTEPAQMATADAVLDIQSEERQQAVVGERLGPGARAAIALACQVPFAYTTRPNADRAGRAVAAT